MSQDRNTVLARHPRPRQRHAGWRVLRIVVIALVGIEALYLVAMNVFLSTPLFGKVINGDPEVIDVHYARAWSFFPTRIHATGLSIRATDSHVEWVLHLDEVDFDCPLRDLGRKLFHVTRARGQGISFRLRMKVQPGTPPDETRWLPPIDSLGPVAVIPAGSPYAGTWSDKDWHLWTIHLENIVAEHVREIWIDGGRFEGDARIAGGFFLKPIRAVKVGPARVEIRSGRATLEGGTVMDPLAANADFLLERFDPRVITAPDLAQLISLSLDATTAIPDVSAVLPHPPSASLEGRVDVPKVSVRFVKGVLEDGTHLEARAAKLDASKSAHSLSAAAEVTADVTAGRLSAHGEVADIATDLGVAIHRVVVSADSARLDLASPLGDLHAIADIEGAEAGEASRIVGLLVEHSPLHVARGELSASAHLEGWREGMRARGDVKIHAKGVDASLQKPLHVHARGELEVDASVGAFEYENRRASDVRVDVRAQRLALTDDSRRLVLDLHAHGRVGTADLRRGTCSVGELRVDGAHLTVAKEGSASALSIAHVSLGASSQHVTASDPLRRLQVVGNFEGGRLSGGALRDLIPGGAITLTTNDDVRFSGDAAAEIRDRVARGAASVRTRGIGFAAKKLQAIGNVAVVADVARWDLANDVLTADVRVAVSDAHGGFGPSVPGDAFFADRMDAHVVADRLDLSHARPGDLDYELDVSGARVPDARALNAFLPSPIIAIESGSAIVGAKIDTQHRGPHGEEGGVRAWLSRAGVRFHETHLAGDVLVDLKGRAAPGAGEPGSAFDLEGSQIAMRNVRVTDSSTDTAAWSGDLVLQEGVLTLDPTPRLAGNVTLRARDASPLLAVLLRGTLPGLLARLTRMPALVASSDFVAEPDSLVVTDLIASGGDLSLLGTYAVGVRERRGAFVVQKGPFSAGIRLDDDGAHLRLFNLNRWYADQRREVRGAVP